MRKRTRHCWTTSKAKYDLKGVFVMFFTLLCWLDSSMEHLFSATELLMEKKILWRLQRLPSPALRPPPKLHQHWITGSITQGVLPWSLAIDLHVESNYVLKFMITMEWFRLQTEELMGHKTCLSVFQFVSLVFFFLLSLLGSWGLGFCWGFLVWFGYCQICYFLIAWPHKASRKRQANRK